MTLPTSYEPPFLLPRIKIYDRDDVLQYQFNAFDEAEQDMLISTLGLHGGIGTDHGGLDLTIIDHENQLTDSTIRGRDVLIKPQWTIDVEFGNTEGELVTWFQGIIFDPSLDRPMNNMQTVGLTCYGKGVRFSDRLTSIRRTQLKSADGLTPDDTDANAKGTTIFEELFTKSDHFLHKGLSVESGFTTDGIIDFAAKIADFQKDTLSITNAAQEIANRLGMVWGINQATLDIFLHFRGSIDSGLLFTNNLTSLLTTGWDKSKLCLIPNKPIGWKDTNIGFGYSILVGKGVFDDEIQYEQTSSNAALALDGFDAYAFPFTALAEDVSKIAPFLTRVGTLTKNLFVSIYGNNGSGKPGDVIREVEIQADYLQNHMSASGEWFEYPFRTINARTPTDLNETYFLVFKKFDNGANDVRIDYQTGTGSYYTLTGSTWSSAATGNAKFRTYHSHPVDIIFENRQAVKKFGVREMSIPMGDFPSVPSAIDAMRSISKSLGKTQRIYKPLVAYAPTSPPLLGSKARLIDKFNGLDQFVDLVGYDLTLDAYGNTARGVSEITFQLEDLFY